MIKSKSDSKPMHSRAAEIIEIPRKSRGAAKPDPVTVAILDELKQNPDGLHFSEIVELLTSQKRGFPPDAINKALAKIIESPAGQVEKPSRGFYRYRTSDTELAPETPGDGTLTSLNPPYNSASWPWLPRLNVRGRILCAALEVLKANPGGLNNTKLLKEILSKEIGASSVAIARTLTRLPNLSPEVEKPYRGFYRYRPRADGIANMGAKDVALEPSASERDFYRPFAEWLMHDTEECTKAVALGGSRFRSLWGTPDVIGILEHEETDPVKFPPEIISAEIKTDDKELIKAFGQACAYKLFSHKSYLVVSKNSPKERLDSLCLVLGIGLVLFDPAKPRNPDFVIRVRPAKHAPDMYYLNENIKKVPELWEKRQSAIRERDRV